MKGCVLGGIQTCKNSIYRQNSGQKGEGAWKTVVVKEIFVEINILRKPQLLFLLVAILYLKPEYMAHYREKCIGRKVELGREICI